MSCIYFILHFSKFFIQYLFLLYISSTLQIYVLHKNILWSGVYCLFTLLNHCRRNDMLCRIAKSVSHLWWSFFVPCHWLSGVCSSCDNCPLIAGHKIRWSHLFSHGFSGGVSVRTSVAADLDMELFCVGLVLLLVCFPDSELKMRSLSMSLKLTGTPWGTTWYKLLCLWTQTTLYLNRSVFRLF